jgi:hypothetical protein
MPCRTGEAFCMPCRTGEAFGCRVWFRVLHATVHWLCLHDAQKQPHPSRPHAWALQG